MNASEASPRNHNNPEPRSAASGNRENQSRSNANNSRSRGHQPSQGHATSNAGSAEAYTGPALRISHLQNHIVENVIKNKMTGEGIKKTPAYETPYTKEKLE